MKTLIRTQLENILGTTNASVYPKKLKNTYRMKICVNGNEPNPKKITITKEKLLQVQQLQNVVKVEECKYNIGFTVYFSSKP